jgi:phosphatidylserine/phosphatidylglycerophosphate/cardiolipin synthase-like enzyme
MGTGVRSVRSALTDMLRDARLEVLICAYSITGGADEILNEFEDCLRRGIRFKVVINRFQNQYQHVQVYLRSLAASYPYFRLYNFDDPVEELHSKLIVVDRSIALVGSANLSMRGMRQNYELGVIVQGTEASVIGQCFDRLVHFPTVNPVLS